VATCNLTSSLYVFNIGYSYGYGYNDLQLISTPSAGLNASALGGVAFFTNNTLPITDYYGVMTGRSCCISVFSMNFTTYALTQIQILSSFSLSTDFLQIAIGPVWQNTAVAVGSNSSLDILVYLSVSTSALTLI
jgi:hypothetical protein